MHKFGGTGHADMLLKDYIEQVRSQATLLRSLAVAPLYWRTPLQSSTLMTLIIFLTGYGPILITYDWRRSLQFYFS